MDITHLDFSNWNNYQLNYIINNFNRTEQEKILEQFIAWSLFNPNNKFCFINVFRIYDNIKSNPNVENEKLIKILKNESSFNINILHFLPLLLLFHIFYSHFSSNRLISITVF